MYNLISIQEFRWNNSQVSLQSEKIKHNLLKICLYLLKYNFEPLLPLCIYMTIIIETVF